MTIHRVRSHPLSLAVLLVLIAPGVHADDAGDRNSLATKLDRLSVVGSVEKAAEAAGSAHYIDAKQLQEYAYSDVQRVLRKLPGVYLVDEEGYGLRPNIGIRGSGTDRNSRITVMEDGVLIAPAPYAAPAAYYFPTMARMSSLEVRKGSSAVKAGPRTTGGAVNLISTPIPASTAGRVDFAYGSDNTVLSHAHVGTSGDRFGLLLETVQQSSDGFKRLDSGGDSGYRLEDYLGKLRYTSDANAEIYQEFELKLGKTEQDGDETYLGLSDADFAADPNRRYAASQRDNIVTDHEQIELRHRVEFAPELDLTSVVYRNEFARNWYKLDSVGGRSIGAILADPQTYAQQYAWITGASSPDNSFVLRNNNRSYQSRGVQSVLAWSIATGEIEHALEFGLRYHEDYEDRFQHDDRYRMDDGSLVRTTSGAPGSQDNRIGDAEALSFFLQDEISFGDWIVTPGMRFETIDFTRTDYQRTANGRDQAPTRVIETSVDQFIPGIGLSWRASDSINAFLSLHRGFNPPGPGSDVDPEESLNTELGLRFNQGALEAELVGFWNDYRNLVGTCTASTGGGCDLGDQFDGGEASVKGIEASAGFDLAAGRGWSVALPLRMAYTYTDAQFDSSFVSEFEEWLTVTAGDGLPYLPEQQWHGSIAVEADSWRIGLAANYLDAMRTQASQGDVPASQLTDQAWVFDLAAAYRLSASTELYARVENLGDEEYIVSRRPAGARPGRPRATFVGLRVDF